MSITSFRIENGSLFIGRRRIDVPYPVGEVVECSGTIVVRVEPPAGEIYNRNVFAFTKQGEQIWQIEESPHGTEKDKPYVGILCRQGSVLVAANWNGVDYLVNIESGHITTKAFNK